MTRLALLRSLVIALLIASTTALALDRPPDRTIGPQQPLGSEQPLQAVEVVPPATADVAGQLPPTVDPGSPPPPRTTAPALSPKAGASTPSNSPPRTAPKKAEVVRCAQYSRGGSVHPLCSGGSKGTMGDVVVERVPGTNVVVNRAWTANVAAFFGAARAAGFTLQAWDVAGPGYGSFRSAEMQRDLRRWGYPANPPGLSMHEWGLAIDLSCNGAKFKEAPAACRDWVRASAGKFGIQNLPSEPWHWSSNGS
ncbi:MAG TPA: M15 family metallopeptidase [Acidimicrobiales bacterium]|nr:M15 family metallopeptidase [Acidimicrobiales bacterium]